MKSQHVVSLSTIIMETQKPRRPPPPRLDEGAKSYYKRVEGFLDGDGEENGDIFLKNVVDQVIVDGVRLVSCDKDGSRALERLLQHFSVDQNSIKNLMRAVGKDFFKLCVNRCGSHVMQTLMLVTSHTLSTHHEDQDLLQLFLSFVSIMEEKLSDYILHPYASHVLGGTLQYLGGVSLGEQVGRSRYSQEFRKAKMVGMGVKRSAWVVPEACVKALGRIARKVGKMANLKELLTHQNGSPVLQSLLRVLTRKIPEKSEKLTKKILKLSEVLSRGESRLPDMFTDLVGSHLMETMIETANTDTQQLIFNTCFKGRVMMSALHPVANFPLQHLIAAAPNHVVKEIFPEVDSVEAILFAGHTGVVVKLMEAAVACAEVQATLQDAIFKAFHTSGHPDTCAPVILALMTHEVYHSKDETEDKVEGVASGCGDEEGVAGGYGRPHPTTLHGSLILQALLKFQDVKTVGRSVLKLSCGEMVRWACDSQGSHVLTTFLTSTTVSGKRKERLMAKLEEHLKLLCLDKHGSRVVDVIWGQSQITRKEELARLLLVHEEDLAADFYGSIVLRNCNIASFRKTQRGWQEEELAASRKRDMFEDILGEAVVGVGEKRKFSGDELRTTKKLKVKKK